MKKNHFLNFFKQPLKQALIQSLANGIYVAQYHIYDGICIARNKMTRILLYKTKAENNVNNKAPINNALVILLSLSTIFLNCFLNPIKKPVLKVFFK